MFLTTINSLRESYFKLFFERDIQKYPLYAYNLAPGVVKHSESNKVSNLFDLNNKSLCEIPKFLLIIEFDHLKNHKNYIYDLARNECLRNIRLIIDYLISNNFYYILTDHNTHHTSKSPHLYILLDFEQYPRDLGLLLAYKRYIFKKITSSCALTFNLVTLDTGFLSPNKTFPILGNPHFKPEHQGAIQEVILEGSGTPIFVGVKDFKLFKNFLDVGSEYDARLDARLKKKFAKMIKHYNLNLNLSSVLGDFHRHFVAGQHNYVAMSISSFLAFYGAPKFFAVKLIKELCNLENIDSTKYEYIVNGCYAQERYPFRKWLEYINYSPIEIDNTIKSWKNNLLKKELIK
jgi:hypothetical protein